VFVADASNAMCARWDHEPRKVPRNDPCG